MLRLDAERFGTAEYYEATRDGERPRVRRRLAWYGLGVRHRRSRSLYIHPAPQATCSSGSGDRLGAVLGGLVYGGDRHRPGRWPSRRFATTGSGFPDTCVVPRARCSTRPRRRSSTRSTFRGAIFGLLLALGLDADLANVIQTLLYALTTRLGAPGRDRYLLVLTLGIGLIGGWLTAVTGGIARGVPGPCDHAVRGLPVHRATPARRCRAAARSRRSSGAVDRPRAGGSSARGSPRSRDR